MTFFLTFSYSFFQNNFGQHFILWVALSFSYLILCGHFLYMEFSLPPSIPADWCFWTVVLEKTLESPLDCKEIKPVHPKGNQSRIFIRRTDVEAETPILWPPDVKNQLISNDPDAGWERLRAGGVDNRGQDGWMASLIQWIWIWANFRRWWRTGKSDLLQSMGSHRVRHDWTTELNWMHSKSKRYQAFL